MNNILLSCVDAGAANYLLPLIHRGVSGCEVTVCASGTAAEILESQNIRFCKIMAEDWNETLRETDRLLCDRKIDLMVCGTSWGLTLDKALTIVSRERHIKTVSVIDHWLYIRQRYIDVINDADSTCLKFITDFCIVIDEQARERAIEDGVDACRILVGGHPHLERLGGITWSEDELRGIQVKKACILFVSERIRDDLGNQNLLTHDEYSVLDDLLRICNDLGCKLEIKLHPQEPNDKYLDIKEHDDPIDSIRKKMSIPEMLFGFDVIVGMDSMLLIELSLWRNGIVSYRPGSIRDNGYLYSFNRIKVACDPDSLKNIVKETMNGTTRVEYSACDQVPRYAGSAERLENLLFDLMMQ